MKPTHIPRTNQQLLREIMAFSKYGPLAEIFVMDAIGKLADAIASADPEKMEQRALIHPAAWVGVAREIKAKIDAHYGMAPEQQEAA